MEGKKEFQKENLTLSHLGMFYSVLLKFLSSLVSMILSSDFPVDSLVSSSSSLLFSVSAAAAKLL